MYKRCLKMLPWAHASVVPLTGTPFLFMPEASALVVADLHIGIEAALHKEGVHLPSSTKKRVEEVIRAGERVEADLLYLLGDLKHTITGFSPGERKEVLWAAERFAEEFHHVYLLPGNHDGGLAGALTDADIDITLMPSQGVLVNGVTLLHGHAAPPPDILGDLIVVGHDHPRVMLSEPLGFSTTRRCWVVAPLKGDLEGKNLMILPAAEIHGGQTINRTPVTFLNIFFKRGLMDLSRAEVFLLDGTFLGLLPELTPEEHEGG